MTTPTRMPELPEPRAIIELRALIDKAPDSVKSKSAFEWINQCRRHDGLCGSFIRNNALVLREIFAQASVRASTPSAAGGEAERNPSNRGFASMNVVPPSGAAVGEDAVEVEYQQQYRDRLREIYEWSRWKPVPSNRLEAEKACRLSLTEPERFEVRMVRVTYAALACDDGRGS